MQRVIADSDDEFDDDLDGPDAAPTRNDAPSKQLVASPSRQPGTGSTDSLKHKIEAAHRAHFQSQPPSIEPQSTVPTVLIPRNAAGPLDENADNNNSKRNVSSADVAPTAASPRKKQKMCENSRSIFSSPMLDGPDKLASLERQGSQHQAWRLEGTLRDEYMAHNPFEIFAETHSTISNTSQTQERLLAEILDPAFLGIDAEAEHGALDPPVELAPAKSSVPWSDFLRTPSGNKEQQSDSSNALNAAAPNDGRPQSSDRIRLSSSIPHSPTHKAPLKSSQHNIHSPSVPIKNQPQNSVDPKGNISTSNHALEELPDDIALVGMEPAASNVTKQSVSYADSTREDDNSKGSKTKQKSSLAPSSDDDFDILGPPAEQYKPRPSRSRSLRTELEEPVDFSARPETAVRKRARRAKTSDGAIEPTVAATPRRMRQIIDMGFTPSTTQRALEQNLGDVSQTVNWLVANAANESDKPATSSGRSRNAKAKKSGTETPDTIVKGIEASETKSTAQQPPQEVSSGTSENLQSEIVDITSPNLAANLEIGIQKTGTSPGKAERTMTLLEEIPRGPTKKAKRRKTAQDAPDTVVEPGQPTVPEPPKEKKRGRGRPRKNETLKKPAEPPAEQVQDAFETTPVPNDTTMDGAPVVPKHDEPVLQEIEPNATASTEIPDPPKDMPREEPPLLSASETPTIKETTPISESTTTPDKQNKKIIPAQSSTTKGKVPYRVGLSKRARIAPLLRSVKK